ncbi:cytidylyltransferase domain-containing protein [Aquimarina mytili]|uniref:3-deoxy-manno-octulosonate cytidylyltransferase n=1 Tax=Aquimarina mytili TaxID=874423 RepID=A0A936ZZC5_9FLAO|nr:hypothetical protein [Aquimarina mytili]MBL0684675.1 hypothetical protein [Aquimarina mytili]
MNEKVIACIIARTVSTRLPLKVLRNVFDDYSMLDYIIQRLKLSQKIDEIVICTSTEEVDDILEDVARKNKVNIYRGSPEKVIERMIMVGDKYKGDVLLRVTGDNVFTTYEYIDRQIELLQENNLDYLRLNGVPIGASAEIMKFEALKKCYSEMDPMVSEYLMLYMFEPDNYKCGILNPFSEDYSNYTITVDTPEDYIRTKEIINQSTNKDKLRLTLNEIISTILENNIINSTYNATGDVKYPYGKIISFKEYKMDMERRINKSTHFFS